MASDPLASVIIPAYNTERYLGEAIESVLSQDYEPFELIVVDDGSTDRTAEVARSFGTRLRLHHQSNLGTGPARNAGIGLARGDLFAFVDADDLWTEGRLALQVSSLLAGDDGIDAVSGHIEQFYSPDLDEETRATIHCPLDPVPGYVAGSMLIRRGSFERVGPYESQWTIGVCMSWLTRAQDAGLRIRMLEDVVLRRRLHAANKGIVHRDQVGQRVRILKAALDRRRKAKRSSE